MCWPGATIPVMRLGPSTWTRAIDQLVHTPSGVRATMQP